MEMETYRLTVYCRRNGVSQDTGIEAEGQFASDESAIDFLSNKAHHSWLRQLYDEIQFSILKADDTRIWNWNWKA